MDINTINELLESCKHNGNRFSVLEQDLIETLKYLKEIHSFDLFKEIVALDIGDNKTELLYHIYSTERDENLFVSVSVENEVQSITDIYKAAEADENEIYDLFGVNFVGHCDLKRLYMPENWIGNPLRKNYEKRGQEG